RRRHTRFSRDWSSDVCSSDLRTPPGVFTRHRAVQWAGHSTGRPFSERRRSTGRGRPTGRGRSAGGGVLAEARELGGREQRSGREIGRASCRERGGVWGGGEAV